MASECRLYRGPGNFAAPVVEATLDGGVSAAVFQRC